MREKSMAAFIRWQYDNATRGEISGCVEQIGLLQNGENGHRSIEEDDGHSEVKVKCT